MILILMGRVSEGKTNNPTSMIMDDMKLAISSQMSNPLPMGKYLTSRKSIGQIRANVVAKGGMTTADTR